MATTNLKGEDDQREEEELEVLGIWDCGSPLYDSYELVSLAHVIERHLMVLPSTAGCASKARFSQNHPDARELIFSPSKFSRPHDDGDEVVMSVMLKNMGPRRNSDCFSSMAASLCEFVVRKMWKRRHTKEEKGHPEKTKTGLPAGFCRKIGLPRK